MNIIHVQNVSWNREGNPILQNINWEVKEHEHWALVGLNGSGKTSLLKMIMGYEWPTKGTVQVLGHTYGDCDIQQVRTSIGWVSSSLRDQLYPNESVLDILISGKYASIGLWSQANQQDQIQAKEILHQIRCSNLSEKRYGTLSQGEKQKILLARALMADPKLVILDEPCFGLDLRSREQFLQLVSEMGGKEGRTILLVTHHIEEIVPIISKVALMADGRLVASGNKEDIITPGWIAEAFQVPVKVDWEQGRPWVRVVESEFTR